MVPTTNKWVEVSMQPVHPDPLHPEQATGQAVHLRLVLSWNWLLPHWQMLPDLVRDAPLADQSAHMSHSSALGPEQVVHVT